MQTSPKHAQNQEKPLRNIGNTLVYPDERRMHKTGQRQPQTKKKENAKAIW